MIQPSDRGGAIWINNMRGCEPMAGTLCAVLAVGAQVVTGWIYWKGFADLFCKTKPTPFSRACGGSCAHKQQLKKT